MLDLLRWVLNRQQHTKDTARQRLQLALAQDRIDLSSEIMEAMKLEVLAVISRYLVVGDEFQEFGIHRQDRSVVLVSNIRVKELNRLVSVQ